MTCEPAAREPCAEDVQGPVSLYDGVDLFFTDRDWTPLGPADPEQSLEIHYCRAGRMVWRTADGERTALRPGDALLCTPQARMEASRVFPTGRYQGLAIRVDLRRAAEHPPEPLRGVDLFSDVPWEKLCQERGVVFLPGGKETEGIFPEFYRRPEPLRLAYQRIRVLELFLYLSQRKERLRERGREGQQPEQLQVAREIHGYLLQHMEQRITIEELSRQYHINPTTLKAAFKAVYGTSLAAHIKEHRMERAARMLQETDMSIAGIAQAVGYDSQSKFTAAFKEVFGALPSVYRRERFE